MASSVPAAGNAVGSSVLEAALKEAATCKLCGRKVATYGINALSGFTTAGAGVAKYYHGISTETALIIVAIVAAVAIIFAVYEFFRHDSVSAATLKKIDGEVTEYKRTAQAQIDAMKAAGTAFQAGADSVDRTADKIDANTRRLSQVADAMGRAAGTVAESMAHAGEQLGAAATAAANQTAAELAAGVRLDELERPLEGVGQAMKDAVAALQPDVLQKDQALVQGMVSGVREADAAYAAIVTKIKAATAGTGVLSATQAGQAALMALLKQADERSHVVIKQRAEMLQVANGAQILIQLKGPFQALEARLAQLTPGSDGGVMLTDVKSQLRIIKQKQDEIWAQLQSPDTVVIIGA